MKLNFLIFASKEYQKRADILVNSIKKYHDDYHIVVQEPSNSRKDGNYLEGMAKARLQKALDLLEEGLENIVILGADCELMGPLLEIENALTTDLAYDIIVVPHVLKPTDNRNWMAHLYSVGHANADFMVFRNCDNAKDCLKWMISVTEGYEPSRSIFYEQTWLTAVPYLFDEVLILRDPGYNIGYWDANKRNIKNVNGVWTADNLPIRLVQYSGFVENSLPYMSKHSNEVAVGDVLKLWEEYNKKVIS